MNRPPFRVALRQYPPRDVVIPTTKPDPQMHPDRESLVRYLAGLIPEDEAELIDRHLAKCADCDDTVDGLLATPDTVIEQLRGAWRKDEFAEEQHCRDTLKRIRQVSGDWTSKTSEESVRDDHDHLESTGVIREYRLLEQIGRGGMGTVYKALHTKLDKVVAMKLLPMHKVRDATAIARFEREMRAVGKLDHPHLVRATDAGESDGMHYLVMELVEGADLAHIANRVGPLSIPDACEVVRQAAVGLQHAFERGLVHRDVKPSNLMLANGMEPTESPLVKVLDLGLALLEEGLADGGKDLTNTGQLMGTIDYMAPEQGTDTHSVDIRADVYSLGATLYKMLTGSAPFAGPEYDSLMKKIVALGTHEPPAIRTLRSDVPEELARLVHRMLSKSASDRPATPGDVATLLSPFAAGADLRLLLDAACDEAPRDKSIHIGPTVSDNVIEKAVIVEPITPSMRLPVLIGASLLAVAILAVVALKFVNRETLDTPETPAGKIPDVVREKTTPPKPKPFNEREVAEWVHGLGGELGLGIPDKGYLLLKPGQKLPAGPFELVTISFFETKIRDADLARLDGLPFLTTLILNSTDIGDAGIAQLRKLPNLKKVYLGDTKVSNAGLRHLVDKFPKLSVLHITSPSITDDGIAACLKLSKLEELRLNNPKQTDAAIDTIIRLKSLKRLFLEGTLHTKQGIERIHEALPECEIVSNYGTYSRKDARPQPHR